jgi:hypothetical protein
MEEQKTITVANCSYGTHDTNCTFTAAEQFPERHLLVCFADSSAIGSVKLCGVDDNPIGTATDEADAGDPVNVHFLGGSETLLMVAASSITQGSILAPAADGRVRVLPESGSFPRIAVAIGSAALGGERLETLPGVASMSA